MKLPAAAAVVANLVEARLTDLFAEEIPRWQAVDSDLAAPLDSLRAQILGGGKRLRAAFCYWAFVGAGGAAEDKRVVDAAAALEVLHSSALVHDDVIDASQRRHGQDTIHVAMAGRHRDSAWKGSPERFGEAVAIIAGDLAIAYSNRLLSGSGQPTLTVFDEMCLEVNIGQYLDSLGAAQGLDLPPEDAILRPRRIYCYKTAKYTVERPMHLGACLAAPETAGELLQPLSQFALPLGEAFQLRDDLLGVFGDPDVTGKPVGDDLREGKPTLLASLALQRDPEGAGRLLRDGLGRCDLDASDIAELQNAIDKSGAKAEVEATIATLVGASTEALHSLPLRREAVLALGELAEFVAGRHH